MNDVTKALWVCDEQGRYQFQKPVPAETVLELATEILESRICYGDSIISAEHAQEYLRCKLALLEHEVFAVLFLDSKHRLLASKIMFEGSISSCSVYPREILKEALRRNTAAVIFGHNHPSGSVQPSQCDHKLTQDLVTALELVEVRVLDHIIVGVEDVYSMAEHAVLPTAAR